jgi:K(+)-stimulated pyrophosphate-energized sodium pump
MNPVIKFTTLFGLLAVELAVTLNANNAGLTRGLSVAFFLVSMFFVWKSFYGMKIETKVSPAVAAEKEEVVAK